MRGVDNVDLPSSEQLVPRIYGNDFATIKRVLAVHIPEKPRINLAPHISHLNSKFYEKSSKNWCSNMCILPLLFIIDIT